MQNCVYRRHAIKTAQILAHCSVHSLDFVVSIAKVCEIFGRWLMLCCFPFGKSINYSSCQLSSSFLWLVYEFDRFFSVQFVQILITSILSVWFVNFIECEWLLNKFNQRSLQKNLSVFFFKLKDDQRQNCIEIVNVTGNAMRMTIDVVWLTVSNMRVTDMSKFGIIKQLAYWLYNRASKQQ